MSSVYCTVSEFWTPRGLVTFYVLFIIHLSTRSVHIAEDTTAPNGAYLKQLARNLTDVGDGFLLNSRSLIRRTICAFYKG